MLINNKNTQIKTDRGQRVAIHGIEKLYMCYNVQIKYNLRYCRRYGLKVLAMIQNKAAFRSWFTETDSHKTLEFQWRQCYDVIGLKGTRDPRGQITVSCRYIKTAHSDYCEWEKLQRGINRNTLANRQMVNHPVFAVWSSSASELRLELRMRAVSRPNRKRFTGPLSELEQQQIFRLFHIPENRIWFSNLHEQNICPEAMKIWPTSELTFLEKDFDYSDARELANH